MMFDLVYKDLLQAFKDKKGMLLSFLLPIVLIALFAMVYGGFDSGHKDRAQQLIISDEDSSSLSLQLTAKLEAEKGLEINKKTSQEAQELVLAGSFPAALIIHKGFSDSVATGGETPLEFLFDESREMEMGLTQKALMSTLMPFLGEQSGKGQVHHFIDEKYAEDLPEEIIAEIHQDIEKQFSSDSEETSISPSALKTKALAVKEGMPWGLIQAFAGTSVMMLLFSITGMGSTLIREKETGTLKRILYSPIKPWQIMIGKLLSGFIFAMIQMTILVLFVWIAFQLDVFRNFGGLSILIIGTALACSGFGVFIASMAKSQKQVESLSLIIILVMSALGGSMIPLFLFPPLIKTISVFTINYWAIDGFYDVLGRDVGILSIMKNAGVLVFIAMLTSLSAIIIFTQRLKKDF